MDAGTVRAWAGAAARALAAAREPIDSLNVFPVPDGDTGTNLALTVAEGAEHATDPGPGADAAEVAGAFARGALLGARGNSGVIVSQYLHGFAQGLAAAGPGEDGVALARALDEAQAAAWTAVARPVEGTILTAATAAATAAWPVARAGAGAGATSVAAVGGAREALERSPQALDVLRAAGVVDAGASGLVVMLEALAAVLGLPADERAAAASGAGVASGSAAADGSPGVPGRTPAPTVPADAREPAVLAHFSDLHAHDGLPGAEDGEFEVMYVVEPHRPGSTQSDLAPHLRARMEQLGGSVAVVGGAGGWHVHVHTDHPADAVAAGSELGAQSQVVVRQLAAPTGAKGVGVVVGTGAPGLMADLARSGALVMVLTGWPVGARDVLRTVVDTGAHRVVVLPGSPAALAAARSAAERSEIPMDVLDADDDARVVAALTAAAGRGAQAVDAMRATLAAVRTSAVDAAEPGLVVAEVRRLLGDGGELVTVVSGAALSGLVAADRLADDLTEALSGSHPGVDVVVLAGGQDTPAAVVAVE